MPNMFRARRSMLFGAGAGAVGYFAGTPGAARAANPVPDDAPANAAGKMMNVEQALDVLYFGVANVRNPKFAGGAKGGGRDDTAAFRAAIASGLKIVYAPADHYVTDTITLPVDVSLIGDGMRQTIIESRAIGASLIKTAAPSGAQVGCIRDLQLLGNNQTGAAGNGHAINFIDPVRGSGLWTPQGMTVERVWIRRFRGQESRDGGSGNRIAAAGIICVEGLQNIYRDVLIHNCGHGFYLERAQTNKIENCTVFQCDKYGIASFQSVATVVDKCDIVGNGSSGATDPGYPADFGMGNIISFRDEVFVFTNNKAKNTGGIAQLYLNSTNGAVVENNWLRADGDATRANVVNHALFAVKCPSIQVNKNTFSHILAAKTSPASARARLVRFATDSVNGVFNGSFSNNTFVAQSGLLTEFNLCLEGRGNNCVFAGWDISGNRFGTPLPIGTAHVIDADIVVRNCAFTHSRIRNNVFYAQANVTRKRGVSGTNLSAYNNLDIGDNLFKQDGGKIADNYDGLLYPTRRLGRGTFTSPRLAPGSIATTTLPVSNAVPGEPVQAFFSAPVPGVILSAWVSEAGTVTVQAFNPTQAALNLGSANVGVVVSRMSDAEAD